jgi:hypothetical protein
MSDKKEQVEKKGEPGLPVKIPISIVRWLVYSGFMIVLLGPFIDYIGPYCCLTGGLILGHFASQLNALIKK